MALPADFLDELRARTPLAPLIGRRVKLTRSGRQWKGCCPFHGEKTPSFYVYDDHFHCFGCGAHGDAISFVMQIGGGGFMEAVEQLAAEAGLAVPKPSPAQAEAERQRLGLLEVLARAQAAFQRRLFLPEGARALAYLRGRGLAEETIRRFALGWSPGRGALAAELGREGIGSDRLVEAGLMQAGGEPGAPPRELFFERIMFPIRDRRGRTIGFGGRTLGDGQPKYLNGPETPLFAKRRALYGLDFAAEAARGGSPVLVVEGYMDVIALHQAGYGSALAPLGTALTTEQLGMLWQLSPEPVLCFDGDDAGRRAALRAAEIALPMLAPDRTLAIAALPEGEDPDTLVQRYGARGWQAMLEDRQPLAAALYDCLREGGSSSPEQRAAFRARLEEAASRIGDRSLAREYRRTLLDRFFAEARQVSAERWPSRADMRHGAVRTAPSSSALRPTRAPERSTAEAALAERQRLLTAILLNHPAVLRDLAEPYEALLLEPWLARLRLEVLRWADATAALDSAELMNHLTRAGLDAEARRAVAAKPFPLPACAGHGATPAEAAAGWWHIFGLLHRERLDQEVAAAEREFAERPDARAERRLVALSEARNKLRQGEPDGFGLPA